MSLYGDVPKESKSPHGPKKKKWRAEREPSEATKIRQIEELDGMTVKADT